MDVMFFFMSKKNVKCKFLIITMITVQGNLVKTDPRLRGKDTFMAKKTHGQQVARFCLVVKLYCTQKSKYICPKQTNNKIHIEKNKILDIIFYINHNITKVRMYSSTACWK